LGGDTDVVPSGADGAAPADDLSGAVLDLSRTAASLGAPARTVAAPPAVAQPDLARPAVAAHVATMTGVLRGGR
ncbi:MAG: hypothetical protein ACYC2O_10290, partial [Microthrixaceae bacterium]